MLGAIFICIFLPLYMLVAGPPLLLYTLISRNPNPLYWSGIKGIVFLMRAVGVKVRIAGRELIPAGACLFVANHTSSADAPAVVGAIPRRVAILLKESLYKWPIAGQAFTLAGFIPVNRNERDSAIASVEKATQSMRLQTFKKGAVVMAIKAGVPIVPIACSGAHKVMRKRSLRIYPGEILVEFLEPIDSSKYSFEERDALNDRVHDAMAAGLPPDQRPIGFSGAAPAEGA
jgi:1-acyl-sn-glycerol-3-phosphate acyltransferase